MVAIKTRSDAPTQRLPTNLYRPALVLPKVGSSHSKKGQDGGWTTGHSSKSQEGRGGLLVGAVCPRGHPRLTRVPTIPRAHHAGKGEGGELARQGSATSWLAAWRQV